MASAVDVVGNSELLIWGGRGANSWGADRPSNRRLSRDQIASTHHEDTVSAAGAAPIQTWLR